MHQELHDQDAEKLTEIAECEYRRRATEAEHAGWDAFGIKRYVRWKLGRDLGEVQQKLQPTRAHEPGACPRDVFLDALGGNSSCVKRVSVAFVVQYHYRHV